MRWLVALALALASVQNPAAGRVTGVVADSAGGVIPGATVRLRTQNLERTTTTDRAGTFKVEGLPPGRYALMASLDGFYGQPVTDLEVAAGKSAHARLTLETDCMLGDERVDRGFALAHSAADVIAHIRIIQPDAACAVTSHCSCTLHRSAVLHAVKGRPPSEIPVLQEGAGFSSSERPYAAGEEFVAFLKRDDKHHAFGRLAGPYYMFPVRNGRVEFKRTDSPGFRDGMRLDEFMKALQAIRL